MCVVTYSVGVSDHVTPDPVPRGGFGASTCNVWANTLVKIILRNVRCGLIWQDLYVAWYSVVAKITDEIF